MKSLETLWNGKLRGVLGSFFLIGARGFQLIIDKFHSRIAKLNIESVGANVSILSGFQYRYPRKIVVGNNVQIGRNVIFSCELQSGYIEVEDGVIIGRNSDIDFSGGLQIGKGTLLSEGVRIQTHDHGLNPRSHPIGKSLNIGKNVWIGLNAMILSNVRKIGDNAIIGAGAIVTKEVPANAIVVGSSAKILRYHENL